MALWMKLSVQFLEDRTVPNGYGWVDNGDALSSEF